MPMSQERFSHLLQVAKAYQSRLRNLTKTFNDYHNAVFNQIKSPDEALNEFAMHINHIPPALIAADLLFMQEETRYTYTHNRNDYERERQAKRRLERGATSRPATRGISKPRQPTGQNLDQTNDPDDRIDGIAGFTEASLPPTPSELGFDRVAFEKAFAKASAAVANTPPTATTTTATTTTTTTTTIPEENE